MTKTPDEIKKGLECCTSRDCGGNKCPYFNEKSCNAAKSADALALIQQLQTENAKQAERIRQLEAERDAAVKDLAGAFACFACEKFYRNGGDCNGGSLCYMSAFEWRGVQKEE